MCGVGGALSFWGALSDMWPLKHSLENHEPLPEPKSWGRHLENMGQDLQAMEVGSKSQMKEKKAQKLF